MLRESHNKSNVSVERLSLAKSDQGKIICGQNKIPFNAFRKQYQSLIRT